MDITEAEAIKKRWQEHAEELYLKDLMTQITTMVGITNLEPSILECEIKWSLGSPTRTKLVEVMEFHLSYLKS